MSTADKLRATGRAEGKAEGRAEGKAEGQLVGRSEILLRQLEKRFGAAARAEESRLRSATVEELDRWALRVLDAATVADVFATE